MQLRQALRLPETPRLALVGAGGKTTALFQLARQFVGTPDQAVLVTTTTHLAVEQASLADHHLQIHSPAQIEHIGTGRLAGGVLLTGGVTEDERFAGLGPELV
ncbi:MAG: hypothetical protein L0Z70_15090, partial [Chloroflexi bacterium]|nr:hypothetical protein [Chloroflexota bacterium]